MFVRKFSLFNVNVTEVSENVWLHILTICMLCPSVCMLTFSALYSKVKKKKNLFEEGIYTIHTKSDFEKQQDMKGAFIASN